ncbi:beta/gamma crystallin-related protein [Pseudoduganella sp. UC29_106]|uniref:beta/gamma crystallin-related protein n=1 Tax=Pseudoduganella sp. UC29_106 TaxID=3374553 RepID=UPI003757AE5E
MKRLIILASLAATLLSQAAAAGELTLFAGEGFRGPSVTLRDGSNNFVDLGFNDRASSMIVRSGQWEVCEHRDFQGACAVFGPGEYPRLARFENAISSARQVGGGGEWRERHRDRMRDRDHDGVDDRYERDDRDGNWQGGYQGGQGGYQGGQGGYQGGGQARGAVELFDGDNLSGRAIGISGDVRTLQDVGFNDRANSMIIHEGVWELCEHADYRGQCFTFGPGRYTYLPNLRDRLSSLRRVR